MEVHEAGGQPQAVQIEFSRVIRCRVTRPQVCPDPPVFEQQVSPRGSIPLGVENLGVSHQHTGHDGQCSGCDGPLALKFKFSSICSRYQAFNRQWQDTLRKIEQGTYTRHRFKADLHQRAAAETRPGAAAPDGSRADDLGVYTAYVEARQACGQDVKNLSPAKLRAVLRKQEKSLRARFGDAEIRFRVVVEDGKAKLKASRGTS